MSHDPNASRPVATLAERVATNVRAELAAQKLGAPDLARTLHIGPRAAARRISGELVFSLNEAELVAEWLGLSITDLARQRPAESTRRFVEKIPA